MMTSDTDDPIEQTGRIDIESADGAIERIEPAPTGVTAFLGRSPLGPVGVPARCPSESAFNRTFGDFDDAPVLAAAVHGFFQNGGAECLVVNLGAEARPLKPGDLKPLDAVDDVELVCAPGQWERAAHDALIAHCERHRTRLALLDGPPDLAARLVRLHPPSSANAACYVPWLTVHDPVRATSRAVPPSGHMAGLLARIGRERGVHKPPGNEPLHGLTGLTHEITQAEQDILHPRRINCIRSLPHLEGIRPWGARTLADRAPFGDIAPLRVFSYVMRSLDSARAWLVGGASEPQTWERLLEAAGGFLSECRVQGLLAGATDDEAFRLVCNPDNNPPEQRERGMVVLDVGLALARPGAFYTVRIGLDLGPS